MASLKALNHFASGGLKPDLTLLFDLDAHAGPPAGNPKKAQTGWKPPASSSTPGCAQHSWKLARKQPRRIKLISVAGKSRPQVLAEAWAHVKRLL